MLLLVEKEYFYVIFHSMNTLKNLSPILLAFLASVFTWFMTLLGSIIVFFFKKINQKFLDTMLGFAGGVMISASFFSLLIPAIEMTKELMRIPSYIPAILGFLLGGLFLKFIDTILPHLHLGFEIEEKEGIKTNWKRTILLVLAVTLHNIPEGLAIGVAFGAISYGFESASIEAAIALAFGIGIQNFPEGVAVALPLRREGLSRFKSFWYGQLSGLVEPFAAIVGAISVVYIKAILPYALSFAAGAMIYVVVEELIPESQHGKNTDIATIGTILGFATMMFLDLAFSK